jgi:hypothetical protein
MSPPHKGPAPVPVPTRRLDPADPAWKSVERVQRARMVLDVATADLEVAQVRLGSFHPTAWHFREALAAARRDWDRLRAEYGGAAIEVALSESPVVVLTLGDGTLDGPRALLVPIRGKTYRVERVEGTEPAPIQWRLTRLPPGGDGPYYACRLDDGATRCDCAEWTFQIDGLIDNGMCKHLAALTALGWI